MGRVDQTLFLLRQARDILIVQVYVDDIVFGGSSNSLVARIVKDDMRVAFLFRATNQAIKGRNICAPS
jgi:hypothetical protein